MPSYIATINNIPITEEILERTFQRALEQAAALECSMDSLLEIMRKDTAAALGSYIKRKAPHLLAQRSPYHDLLDGPITDKI